MCMNQCWSLAFAAVRYGAAERGVTFNRVGAVTILDVQAGITRNQFEMLPPAVCTSTGTEIA